MDGSAFGGFGIYLKPALSAPEPGHARGSYTAAREDGCARLLGARVGSYTVEALDDSVSWAHVGALVWDTNRPLSNCPWAGHTEIRMLWQDFIQVEPEMRQERCSLTLEGYEGPPTAPGWSGQ